MILTKFQVNWPFDSEEVKNRFSRLLPWWPSWSSDQNDFSYFWSTSHLYASYQVSSQLSFRFRRRSEKKIFKMAAMAAILISGWDNFSFFWSTSHPNASYLVLAFFDQQVTPMLPTQIQVNQPFGSGEEVKNRFSRRPPWSPSWISNRNNFTFFFDLQVTLMLPTKFRVNWPFGSGEEVKSRFSRWAPW